MHNLLEQMGYDASVVHIFDAQSPASHTFIHVLNPETSKCQTQDPDFKMYWIEVKTGARIAVVDYAPDNLDKVEPCNDQGCGWDVVVQANKLKGRFDRVTLDDYARHWTAYWWAWLGSNQRPLGCEPNALPLSYTPHNM